MLFEDIKMLVVGSFNAGALENFFVNGFMKQGLKPDTFDITKEYYPVVAKSMLNKVLNKIKPEIFFSPINKSLLQFISMRRYDVILVVKGLTLYPSTIETLKQHTKIISCYNPDHPFKFYSEGSGNKHIKESIRHYDIYFSYAKKIVGSLQKEFNVQSFVVPFGYNEDAKPSVTASINCNDKILFIGAYDNERAKLLTQIADKHLAVYGDAKWKTRTGRGSVLQKNIVANSLFSNDYASAISTADGVLNFLRPQNIDEDSHNMRTFEVPGYGGLLISNRTSEQMEFFREDHEALFFDSVDELRDKIKFIDQNKTAAANMKKAAHERAVSSNYSYYHRSIEMIKEIKKFL